MVMAPDVYSISMLLHSIAQNVGAFITTRSSYGPIE